MAPMPPMGRARAMKLVEGGRLPIWLGSPHPSAMILEQDGVYRIRSLEIDPARARAEEETARVNGRPWMPEQYYGLGEPIGTIHLEATSRDGLLAAMAAYAWPANW